MIINKIAIDYKTNNCFFINEEISTQTGNMKIQWKSCVIIFFIFPVKDPVSIEIPVQNKVV